MRSVLSSRLGLLILVVSAVLVSLRPSTARAADGASVRGIVTHARSKEPIDAAYVLLQCSCLAAEIETETNTRGTYRFSDLPAGRYTVQVFAGKANVSKTFELPRNAQFKANFRIDPKNDVVIDVVVPPSIKINTETEIDVDRKTAQNVPFGDSPDSQGWAVIDAAPSAGSGPAGATLSGGTGGDVNYTVDGQSVGLPGSNTVGISVIREFLDGVNVLEAGYDAEYGGASTGQVNARRRSGTNVLRGEAGFRITPRLAQPRFITGTDESLRVTVVPDLGAEAYGVLSGPILKDRLFYTVGVSPQGKMSTLRQQFHHRVDKDGSGGFEGCPFENGKNDCANGRDYILTEKFAEQTFRLGGAGVSFVGGVDFRINPKHELSFTALGGPGFNRTTYRLPFSTDPTAFGTNPDSDPLSGTSNIATGVVNDHFGWDYGNSFSLSLGYFGRVANDNVEIDAGVGMFQSDTQRAWRLDNPENYRLPATQETAANGRNLYEFLDREGRVALVPGVADACNDASLPGVACPTRRWLSGGVGEYGETRARRISGRLALTHFLSSRRAGNHQLKYGGNVEYLTSRVMSRYSGSNGSDFADNCEPGQKGGGEWCFDRGEGYTFQNDARVNNNRFVLVDPNTPEQQITQGYGRIRREQNELRAIANGAGDGVRVPEYDETTSTYNYAVFLQDKWAVRSNLFLNYGVRWEMQDMRDALGRPAVFIWDNVAPRLGVVYDWTDEGRSRLYASYGWFFQPLPLQLNSRVFGGLVNVRRSYAKSNCEDKVTNIGGERFDRYDRGQPTQYCVDSAAGSSGFTTGLLPANVVPNLKGPYNQQFQMGYEQELFEDFVVNFRWLHTDLGRAVEDVSTDGGNNFILANPGEKVAQSEINRQGRKCDRLEAELAQLETIGAPQGDISAVAREATNCRFLEDAYQDINTVFDPPSRNYDAWTLQAQKRFSRNWLLLASYTFSRQVGNYDGYVDTQTGAINLGASTQYDIPELVRNSYGPLTFNQPHVAKVDGYYTFDFRESGALTLGASFRAQSGYPINLKANQFRYPSGNLLFLLPRGAGGRIQPNYRVNLSAGYVYALPKDVEIEFSARFFNVTNAKAVLRVDDAYTFQLTRGIPGGSLSDLKHAKVQPSADGNQFFSRTIVARQGNFGVETSFQQPLGAQFELKVRY